jgi:DNA adenine methylase
MTRPLLRYHGGKWELADWIIRHFPPHRVYVEPFGGAASVLLQKPRSYGEVYNDLDGEIVNLFRVIREQPGALERAVRATPFSRTEYVQAFQPSDDPVERARQTLIRSHMGRAGQPTHGIMTGFRAHAVNSGTHPATQWRNFPEHLPPIVERWRGVVVEHKPAVEVIASCDDPQTLFYLDPPYVFATRDSGKDYRHEMTDADHEQLAAVAHGVDGMVVISGYHSALYDRLYAGWQTVEREALAEGAATRTEVLWFNAHAWDRLHSSQSLFGAGVAS